MSEKDEIAQVKAKYAIKRITRQREEWRRQMRRVVLWLILFAILFVMAYIASQ